MQRDPTEVQPDRLGGRRVLAVMAAEAEYGAALRARIHPLLTGVGPVEGALATGIALQALAAGPGLPDLVLCLGSAGSRRLEQGRVYQAATVSWRDIDASPLGFPKGITPFLDQDRETALPAPIPGLPGARLSTGADIVTGAAYDAIDADMVDMETYAVLRACQAFDVPLVALRGISDGAEELRHVGDWTQYLHVIDAKLAAAVEALEQALDDGSLSV